MTLLAVLLALAARRFGWGEERFAGARHAWGEAAYRAGGTWGDFVDWVRLGGAETEQLPWWIGGPVLGLCVVAIRALLNARLGVTGAFSEVIDRVGRRSLAFDWRGWFFVGLLAGGLAFALVRGGPGFDGYGWLTRTFEGDARSSSR